MRRLALVLVLAAACDRTPPPPPQPAPELPADVRAEISRLKEEQRDLYTKKQAVEVELEGLQQKIKDRKTQLGLVRYMVKLKLHQSRFSLDLEDHLKDAMNTASFWVAVDREMYDSMQVGREIVDSFRVGSFLLKGSVGSWKITVVEKKTVEKE